MLAKKKYVILIKEIRKCFIEFRSHKETFLIQLSGMNNKNILTERQWRALSTEC